MIEIVDVHKSFGTVPVLKGISLNIKQGEVVCLIGASGSGKSTLLRCINALESYDTGEIKLLDQRVEQRSRQINRLRTQVGMVFQRFNLFPHRTALENVMEGPVHVKREPSQQRAAKPSNCSARWDWARSCMCTRINCRVGSSSAWPLRARWP